MPRVRKPAGDETKRRTASTRLTPATMAKLDAALAESGRSLAQEIEARIEQSFTIEDELGGADGLRLFRAMAFAMSIVDAQVGDWRTDRVAFGAAQAAVNRMMTQFAPPRTGTEAQELRAAIERKEIAEVNQRVLEQAAAARWPAPAMPPAKPGTLTLRAIYEHAMQNRPAFLLVPADEVEQAIEAAGLADDDAELVRELNAAREAASAAGAEIEQIVDKIATVEAEARAKVVGFVDRAISMREGA